MNNFVKTCDICGKPHENMVKMVQDDGNNGTIPLPDGKMEWFRCLECILGSKISNNQKN